MLKDYESMAASLYDGGWREEDREGLVRAYNLNVYDADMIVSLLCKYARDETKENYVVSVVFESPYGVAGQKYIGTFDYASARSYRKHFYKRNRDLWSDREQIGTYCMCISKEYCTNWEQFAYSFGTGNVNYTL